MADKANTVVTMERKAYSNKVLELQESGKYAVGSVDSEFNFSSHVRDVR